jgi:hypothetical protein
MRRIDTVAASLATHHASLIPRQPIKMTWPDA